jgi:hypothetical protein
VELLVFFLRQFFWWMKSTRSVRPTFAAESIFAFQKMS